MNLLGTLFFTSSFLVLGLGLLVFWKRDNSSDRLVFSLFCLTIFGWLFGYGMMQLPTANQLLWARIGHSSVIFVPISYLHFVAYFLKLRKMRVFLLLYYVVGFISLVLMHATTWYVPSVKTHWWGVYPIGGPVMWFDFLLLAMCAAFCWVMFIIRCRQVHRTGSAEEYNRLKYGSIAMTILSLSMYDFLPKLLDVDFYPFGFGTTTTFVLLITYAILKRKLMDINIAIRGTVVYSILAALITAVYFSLVLIAEKSFQGIVGYRSLIGSLAAGFVIALGFNPLKELVQRFIDKLFSKSSPAVLAEENERLRHELARSEKLKAVATFAAGMAHEIKNPLASIKTFAEYLPEKYDDHAYREKFARVMSQEVDKMNALVQRLLEFARPTPPSLQRVQFSGLVKDTLEFLQGTLLQKQVHVETRLSDTDEIVADPTQMKQVLLNLLLNSVEAMEPPGHISIATAQHKGHLAIRISDTGKGIPKKDLAHVFDPFYTTKPRGTGLGLSVVHSIIREHGGRIAIENQEGRGTEVSIQLPINHSDGNQHTADSRERTADRRGQWENHGF